jgi:hypothetical protein
MFVFSWLMNSSLTNRRLDMARFLNLSFATTQSRGRANYRSDDALTGNGPDNTAVLTFLDSDCVVRDSHFEGNTGTVVWSSGPSPHNLTTNMEVSGCLFKSNTATCISAVRKASCVIEHNLFLGNSGPGVGTGVNLRDIPATVRFNTFAYNSAAFTAGGIVVQSNSDVFTDVVIENNTFWGCHAPELRVGRRVGCRLWSCVHRPYDLGADQGRVPLSDESIDLQDSDGLFATSPESGRTTPEC